MVKVTSTTVKNQLRPTVFNDMVGIFTAKYGKENIYQIGDSEIAVKVATAPTGEPIYAVYSPTIKEYCDRKTSAKTIYAFNAVAERDKYIARCKEKEEKAKEDAENKRKKTERDKAAREKAKAERLKREKGEH